MIQFIVGVLIGGFAALCIIALMVAGSEEENDRRK